MGHVGISVSDDTKEQWENYIENTDYGSMSELVRSAVRKEIRSGGGGTDAVPRELRRDMDRLAETQESLRNQMAQLHEGFEDVQEQASEGYPEEVVELAEDLSEDLEEIHEDAFADIRDEQVKRELKKIHKRHPDDPPLGMIEEALEYLEENLSYVQSVPTPPSDYYRVRRAD